MAGHDKPGRKSEPSQEWQELDRGWDDGSTQPAGIPPGASSAELPETLPVLPAMPASPQAHSDPVRSDLIAGGESEPDPLAEWDADRETAKRLPRELPVAPPGRRVARTILGVAPEAQAPLQARLADDSAAELPAAERSPSPSGKPRAPARPAPTSRPRIFTPPPPVEPAADSASTGLQADSLSADTSNAPTPSQVDLFARTEPHPTPDDSEAFGVTEPMPKIAGAEEPADPEAATVPTPLTTPPAPIAIEPQTQRTRPAPRATPTLATRSATPRRDGGPSNWLLVALWVMAALSVGLAIFLYIR